MKQTNHNEVDLLLRSLARARETAAWQSSAEAGDIEGISAAHLDADELNSYAEGVAPAAARARYIEHLADCAACRGIVVGLSQAAGVANRLEVPEQKGGASFWQKLGALLSPPVLRIAVSALVLIAVVGIGFVALRQKGGSEFVAQNEPKPAGLPTAQNNIKPPVNPTPELQPKTGGELFSVTPSESPDKRQAAAGKTAGAEEAPPATIAKAVPKDAGSSVNGADAREVQPFAREPKAEVPSTPMFDTEKSAGVAKEQPVKREDRSRDQDEVLRNEGDDIHGPNRARNAPAPAATQRSGLTLGRGGPSSMEKSKKAAEAETRTVMGRQFTREGDAWVDVAYDSSRATVRLSRGSDQFRALVADEPGIRTIAEQLNGVVIVVWKGRAYRIQ
ncbi:MAG TPA: zf-HC2 domain-containing protein [Pyrinomonadaceae bacterium]|jgi:hypothetical protein|nr:zf-HC2 domain-containing protein [Pyrinomonadaceae bacterium]